MSPKKPNVMGENVSGDDKRKLPLEVGAAIIGHCSLELLAGRTLPNPEDPNAVLNVAQTVMNQADIPPGEMADFIPQVREVLAAVRDIVIGTT